MKVGVIFKNNFKLTLARLPLFTFDKHFPFKMTLSVEKTHNQLHFCPGIVQLTGGRVDVFYSKVCFSQQLSL